MVAVGKISIDMVAYTGKLLKPMKQAQSSVTKFTKHVKAMANTLKTVVLPLAGIAAGVVTVGSAVALVKKQFGDIDEIAKEADRLGIATEQLTALQHAADLAGVSAEELTTALQYMLRKGLNVRDLGAIASKMEAIVDPAERMKFAVETFGRGGAGMINVLQGGAESLRNIVKDAERLGLTFSRMDASKVEEANDAITRMKAGLAGLGRMAAVALAPFVEAVANWFTDIEAKLIGFIDNWKKNFESIREWWPGFFDALLAGIEANWGTMLVNIVDATVKAMNTIGNVLPIIFNDWAEKFVEHFTGPVNDRVLNMWGIGGAFGVYRRLTEDAMRSTGRLPETETTSERIARVMKAGIAGIVSPTSGTTWNLPKLPGLLLDRILPEMPEPDRPRIPEMPEPDRPSVVSRIVKTLDLGVSNLLDAFRQQPQWEDIRVGAAERGSQEAFSAIMNTQKKVEEQHFEEAKRQTGLLQSIAATKITLAITSMMHP